jgi:uncharacterized membrane protein
MRLSLLARTVLPLTIVVLGACSDSRTAPNRSGSAASRSTAPTLDEEIVSLLQTLPSGLANSGQVRWNNVKRQLELTPTGPVNTRGPANAGRQQLVNLVKWVKSKTNDFTPPAGEEKVHLVSRLVLDMSLFAYGGGNTTPPPVVPTTGDLAVTVVDPATPDTTATPTEHAAVIFPAGSVSEPTVLVITSNDTPYPKNCSGPLNTTRCQYPQFYKFNAFPDVKLNVPAKVAVCHVNTGTNRAPLPGANHDNFRLAHDLPVDPANYNPDAIQVEGVEILPLINVGTTTNCAANSYASALPTHSGAFGSLFDHAGRIVGRFADAVGRLMTPKSAYAIDGGGGGETLFFSDFVVLDPQGAADETIGTFRLQELEGYPGGTVHLTALRTANIGTAAGGVDTTEVRFSTDTTITTDDTQIGTFFFPALAPGEVPDSASGDLVIPEGTAPGTYFIGALADASNLIPESNESNNSLSVRITVLDPTPQYSVAALPTLGPDTAVAADINNSGVIVGQSRIPNAPGAPANRFAAVYWSGGTIHQLPDLGGPISQAASINNNGEIVGTSRTFLPDVPPANLPLHAVYWSAAGGLTDLGQAGTLPTVANSINDAGDVVGAAGNQGVDGHAIRWPNHGALIDDGTFGFFNASYRAINNTGEMLMNADVGDHNTKVFVFRPGDPRQLVPDLGSTSPGGGAIANDVSDNGAVVGLSGDAADNVFPYRSRAGGPAVSLGTLGGASGGQATAVNVHGAIVGQSPAAIGVHAFIWTPGGGMQALPELPGAVGSAARGINRDGTIVGQMTFVTPNPGGQAPSRTKAVVWSVISP